MTHLKSGEDCSRAATNSLFTSAPTDKRQLSCGLPGCGDRASKGGGRPWLGPGLEVGAIGAGQKSRGRGALLTVKLPGCRGRLVTKKDDILGCFGSRRSLGEGSGLGRLYPRPPPPESTPPLSTVPRGGPPPTSSRKKHINVIMHRTATVRRHCQSSCAPPLL